MGVKECLKEYRWLVMEVEMLIDSITVEVPLIVVDMRVDRIIDNLQQIAKTNKLLDSITEPMDKEFMTRRYINGETLESIADSMCYSYRNICRINSRILEGLRKGE